MCQPGRVRAPQTLDLALPLLKLVADSGISPDPYLKELKLENALGRIATSLNSRAACAA